MDTMIEPDYDLTLSQAMDDMSVHASGTFACLAFINKD